HLAWFVELAERAEPELERADMVAWADALHADHDNLRAAMDWSVESDNPDDALRLTGALPPFWLVRNPSEGRARLETALAMDGGTPAARAKALVAAAACCNWLMDYSASRPLSEQALALAREVGDPRLIARALARRARDMSVADPAVLRALCAEA